MKRLQRILVVFAVLLMPVLCEGATYYASPTGSGTTCSLASPCTAVYTINTKMSAGDTACILPGTHDVGTVLNIGDATRFNGSTITGCLSDGTISESARDTAILGGASASTLFYSTTGSNTDTITIKNMTLRPNGASRFAFRLDAAVANLTVRNVLVEPQAGTGYNYPLKLVNCTGLLIDRCRIRSGEIASGVAAVSFYGNSEGTISNSIIEGLNGDTGWMNGNIISTSTGTINVYNNSLSGANTASVTLNNAGGTLNLKNNIIYGQGTSAVDEAAGTLNADYNLVVDSPTSPESAYFSAGVTDGGHNLTGVDPKLHAYGRGGYIIPCVDDSTSSTITLVAGTAHDGTEGLEKVLSDAGMSGTWYIYTHPGNVDWSTAGNRSILQGLVGRGTIEIAAHTHSHTDVRSTLTTWYVMSHTTGTTKQYKIDRTNHQFCVKIDADEYCQAWTDGVTTFATLWANIQAHGPGTWSLNTPAMLTSTQVKISSITPTTAEGYVDLTTAMTLDKTSTDCTGGACTAFYLDEIYTPKTTIAGWVNQDGNVTDPQTGATYTANSFAEPGGAQDATSKGAVRTSGYLGGRPSGSSSNLTSMDIYSAGYVAYDKWIGADEAETVKNINSIAAQAAMQGRVIFLLIHAGEVAATGANSMTTVINALQPWHDSGAIKVQSAQKTYAELRAAPWTYTAATGVSTRTYTTYSDFRIRPGSSAANAGTDICATLTESSDYAGRTVCSGGVAVGSWIGGVEIGAYSGVMTGAGVMLGF